MQNDHQQQSAKSESHSKQQSSTPVQYHQISKLKHFSQEMPLPQTVRIFSYTRKIEQKKKKKLKDKFETFKYYQNQDTKQIHKILFITNDLYVDQGTYPFTDPSGQVKKFTQLVNVKRLFVAEAAYIGHWNDWLIIKKMEGVKLGQNGTQFQTDNDDFELIKINNEQRFNQFKKLMSFNPNSINMSIRVIIDESQTNQSRVIDYEFFYREKQLSKKHQNPTKNIQNQSKNHQQSQKK